MMMRSHVARGCSSCGIRCKSGSLIAVGVLMHTMGQIVDIVLQFGGPPRLLRWVRLLLVKKNYGLIWIVITVVGLIYHLSAKKEVRVLLVSHRSRQVGRCNS